MSTRSRLAATLVLVAALLLQSVGLVVASATFQLSGRVTDQSGNALAGATVEVINPVTSGAVASTTTNASGNYALSVEGGTYDIRVTPPVGSSFQTTTTLGRTITSDTTVDFVLVPASAVTLSGRVLDGVGEPVPNQQVSLHPAGGGAGGGTRTDAAGNYSIQVAPGSYHLAASACCGNAGATAAPYSYGAGGPISLTQSTILDLPLPVKRVSVRVQDPAGNPVANVAVNSTSVFTTGLAVGALVFNGSSDDRGTTDAAGNTTLWLFPTAPDRDKYTLTATPPAGSPFATFNVGKISVDSDENLGRVLS